MQLEDFLQFLSSTYFWINLFASSWLKTSYGISGKQDLGMVQLEDFLQFLSSTYYLIYYLHHPG